eukprot:evm.model.NODE_21403_length_7257_cov_21.534243.2
MLDMFKRSGTYARVEGDGRGHKDTQTEKTHLETKRSHDALMDGERGIGPDLHESILAEAQVLKPEIALPEAQL